MGDRQLGLDGAIAGPVISSDASAFRYEVKVLTLGSASDRQARMRSMLTKMGIQHWSFFEALPASASPIGYDEIRTFRKYGSVMSPAEISCAASHIAIIRDFTMRDDLDYIVALEDDVILDPTFEPQRVIRAMDLLGVDYLKLYARYLVPSRLLASFGRSALYRFAWPPCGTQGYILSKWAAVTILGSILRRPSLEMPIDQLMDRYWETGVAVYAFYPFPLMELNIGTSIHTSTQRAPIYERNRELAGAFGGSRSRRNSLLEKVKRRLFDRSLRTKDIEITKNGRSNRVAIGELIDTPPVAPLAT